MLSGNRRIMAKALPLLLVVFLLASLLGSLGCGGGGEVLLTLTKGDQTATYTLKQLKAESSVEGKASFMSSTGQILGEATFKGVELSVLATDVGGLGAGEAAKLTAKDEYSMTMTYDQIAADAFTTFNASGAEVAHGDLKVIVAYEKDGAAINADAEGPLRLVIVAADGTLVTTEGHWWVKWLTQIDIEQAEVAWTLQLIGAITENMTNNTFEAGASPGCHGITYNDGTDSWEGIALWRIIGRVDDTDAHTNNAFNIAKATTGYQVKLTASDGFSKTFEITAIPKTDDPATTWLLAYKKNGAVLPALTDTGKVLAPLKLVGGTGLTSGQKVGGIVKIELLNLPS